MRFQYDSDQPCFTVRDIDVVMGSRDKNFSHSYRGGRTKHGFIYVVKGMLRDSFVSAEEKRIDLGAGDLVFIPKSTV